jgi:hypothetical protein
MDSGVESDAVATAFERGVQSGKEAEPARQHGRDAA